MHIIARKFLEKRASQDIALQLASAHPTAYNLLGKPGMLGYYSNYTPEGQYLSATAPSTLSDALIGGIGGLGAATALSGISSLGIGKNIPPAFKATAGLGGMVLGGLFGLGSSTGQYLAGKYLMPTGD